MYFLVVHTVYAHNVHIHTLHLFSAMSLLFENTEQLQYMVIHPQPLRSVNQGAKRQHSIGEFHCHDIRFEKGWEAKFSQEL